MNLNGNHYDTSLLSSSASDDYSDDDEVQILCINNNNTLSSSKKLYRKIENDFSPNTSTLSDNDPDILQCNSSGDRHETTFTKTLKEEPLNVKIARKLSPYANCLSDNDLDIADYYSSGITQDIEKGIANLGMIGSKSK